MRNKFVRMIDRTTSKWKRLYPVAKIAHSMDFCLK